MKPNSQTDHKEYNAQVEQMTNAQNYARKTMEPVVFYYDEDMSAWWYVSENIWDMMVDNGQVEINWFYCLIAY